MRNNKVKNLDSFEWTRTELLLAMIFKILCETNNVPREKIDEILRWIFYPEDNS